MADNVVIPASGTGTATPVVATDEVSSAHYQKVKLDGGGDGVSVPVIAGQQAMAASLPIVIASNQTAVPVSGTVTATVTGVSTAANQTTEIASLASIDGKITAVNTGAVVVSSSALPSGASTSAKQPALGTAGTPSADVISVQGVPGGTSIPVTATLTSTTITGNVTVVQGTGTNLHAVLDSGTTTVTQGTGSNLHTVVDSGTITTVSTVTSATVVQGTASNLKAEVVGSGSAGTAATGVVTVQGIASMTPLLVTPAANSAVNLAQVGATNTVTGGVNGSLGTGGNVAHDGVNAGNPDYAGAEAIAFGTNPTAVAAADRTKLYANRAGVPFVLGGHPNARCAVYLTTGAQTDDGVLAAIGSGLKYAITRYEVTVDSAATVSTSVRMGFGASVVPALPSSGSDAVEGILMYHPGLVPGSGIVRGDGSGILGVGGDGEELRITCTAPTTGTLAVAVTFFTIES